jgi:nitroreductase
MSTIHFTDRNAAARARPATRALAQATVAALRAPSILNTQPWRWRIHDDIAELRADRTRQLHTLDPDGRLLILSCGAALHHALTALAGLGATASVRRFPAPHDPDLVATIEVTGMGVPAPSAVRLQQAIALRVTDRRPFDGGQLPAGALDALRRAAESNGAHLHVLRHDETVALGVAAARAAASEQADPAFRAEVASWTGRPADSPDGVPAGAVPPSGPRPVPVREFALDGSDADAGRAARRVDAAVRPADRDARYALLFTDSDDAPAWLAAGQALSAMLLTATVERFAVSPMSEVVEVPAARQLLRGLLAGTGYPVLALRTGVPADGDRPARSPRRAERDVIDVVVPDQSNRGVTGDELGSR